MKGLYRFVFTGVRHRLIVTMPSGHKTECGFVVAVRTKGQPTRWHCFCEGQQWGERGADTLAEAKRILICWMLSAGKADCRRRMDDHLDAMEAKRKADHRAELRAARELAR